MTGQLTLHFRKLKTGALYQPTGVDGQGDGREVQKGGDIYIYTCG